MSFNEDEFRAEMAKHKAYSIEEFLRQYNGKYEYMSQPTLYNKMSGRSDFTRAEISNISQMWNLSGRRRDQIFFA